MLTFDDLTRYSKLVFDDLDEAFIDAYEQQGAASIGFTAAAYQSVVEIIVQGLDVELIVSSESGQEWVAGSWTAVAYLQQGRASAFFFTLTTQEHVPVFGGIEGQSGDAILNLFPNSGQAYLGGALAGEVLQQGEAYAYFDPTSVQGWYPQSIAATAYLSVSEVAPFASDEPTEIIAQFNDELATISQIRLTFSSTDADWDAGIGPNGGLVAVEVAVMVNQVYIPLVSLSKAHATAVFFEGDRFDALRTAILGDTPRFKLGGFESLEEYSAPRSLVGTSVLGVEATS